MSNDIRKSIENFGINTSKKEEKATPEHTKFNRKRKEYKIVGVRFTKEEYNKILKKAVKYESMSDYIKTLINKDINK